MTDTPLYCPCGNQLGALRQDGTFVSQHKKRGFKVTTFATGGDPSAGASLLCEACQQWTQVDNLRSIV